MQKLQKIFRRTLKKRAKSLTDWPPPGPLPSITFSKVTDTGQLPLPAIGSCACLRSGHNTSPVMSGGKEGTASYLSLFKASHLTGRPQLLYFEPPPQLEIGFHFSRC